MADAQSIFKRNFKAYISSLRNTSFDKENSIYLCNDTSIGVYDFDAIVKNSYPSKQPSSYDALLIDNNKIFCIEFKNEKYSDITNSEIEKKLTNGKSVLLDIFTKNNIAIDDYTFIFCVAYKNTNARWRRGIAKNTIQFGLEEFKETYFDEIYTNDINFFINEYKKYFYTSLAC